MANPDQAPDLIDELSDAMADYVGEHCLWRALMYAMDEMGIGLYRGVWLQYAPAQRIEARSDETPEEAVQPEGREPGPKDAPKGVGHAQ